MQPVASENRNAPTLTEFEAGQLLLACLERLGEKASNPVLELLAGEEVVIARHYPERALRFGGGGWRAYYHCHETPDGPEGAHGHFHIFAARPGAPEAWTHVVALAMDRMGQPQHWFTVNHWVSGGVWCPAPTLLDELPPLRPEPSQEPVLVGRWLTAMLALFSADWRALLRERDRALESARAGAQPLEEMLKDRSHYVLSRCPVDLVPTLGRALGVAAAETEDQQRSEQGCVDHMS